MGGVFILSLIHPLALTALVALAAFFGTSEITKAMRHSGWHVPSLARFFATAIVFLTYFYGPTGQWLSLVVSLGLLVLWRVGYLIIHRVNQSLKQTLRDFGGTAFTLVYIPLLLSFAVRLMEREDGVAWVFGLVLTVVLIDTFGYLIGRFFGRTKFAPGISPKKTWEGFAASVVGALVGGQIIVMLTETNWAFGLLFGVTILISSVMGDLSESLIKRDLNVKDMGDVLPGHGGVLDRIDSLLPSTFVGYLVSMLAF
ncbi:MAG: phosphatidate cytidylyltransferase [Aquiluna sp.]|nr:phosphatidate cytidylyltransferase [Aquiluna sp.]